MLDQLRDYLRRWRRLGVVQLRGHDAFISYNQKDALPYARALWTALENEGLTVFRDERDLEAGAPLSESLENKVIGSQDFILLDTPGAAVSKYVIAELEAALGIGTNIIRIRFTCFRDMKYEWARARMLEDRLRIDEDASPGVGPSPGVIDRVLRAHGARRKRRQFMAMTTSTIAALATALVLISLSVSARRRADLALAAFRDPAISMADARHRANAVLGRTMFGLFDLFASRQHWQLRDLLGTTYLKARVDVPAPRGAVTIPFTLNGPPTAEVTTGQIVARSLGSGVSLWRRRTEPAAEADQYARLETGQVRAMTFSPEGRQLFLMSRPDYLNAWALTVVDVASGTVLHAAALAGSQNGGKSGSCQANENSIAAAAQTVRVCYKGVESSFDVLPANGVSYEIDWEARRNVVRGGDFTPDGAVAFWVETGKVYLCTPDGYRGVQPIIGCKLALREVETGDDDIRHLSLARQSPGLYDLVLTKPHDRQLRWRCQDAQTVQCVEGTPEASRSTVLAVSSRGTTIEVDGLNQTIVRSADGTLAGSPSHEAFMRPGMRPVAAVFDESGTRLAVAMQSREMSLIAIGTRSFTGGIEWHSLTTGSVLALRFSNDGRRVTTLEHWNAVLMRRTYALARSRNDDATG
jgi:hypothetical protein